MNTRIVIALIVVLAALGGAWWLWGRGMQPVLMPQNQQPQHVLQGTPTSTGDLEYTQDQLYYKIHFVYPAKTKLADAQADARVRLTIEQNLLNVAQQFKQDTNVENFTPHDVEVQNLGGDRKYTLDGTYKAYSSGDFISYVFTIYSDTLGAHPNGFFKTFTFDQQGEEVMLPKLFKPDLRFLNVISLEAYKQVLAQLKDRAGGEVTPDMEDEVRIGTAPEPENFESFYLSDNALHLIIPPYQAAAYAAGSFDVAIPLSELSDILK